MSSKSSRSIAIVFPCNEQLNTSGKILFNTISILDHYIENLLNFVDEQIDEAEAKYYGETCDKLMDIFSEIDDKLAINLFTNILVPYKSKYPNRNLTPDHNITEDIFFDSNVSDDELAMRILDLIPVLLSYIDKMTDFGFFLNVMFDVMKKDLPDEMWTHRKMNPINFLKYSLWAYARYKNKEDGYNPTNTER